MRYICYMHHPAHFHFLKNVIQTLEKNGDEVRIICQKKDVLTKLLENDGFQYKNFLPKGRMDNKLGMLYSLIRQDFLMLKECLSYKPELMFGCSGEICHIGKLLRIPSYYFNEDDIEVVPLLKYLVYPFATKIVAPQVCNTGKWKDKTITYNGNHELAYLHPKVFSANRSIKSKYIKSNRPYVIIRFAKLKAHHDKNVRGIDFELAEELIEIIKKDHDIYITSEIKLPENIEKYRLLIDPIDLHHVMAYARLYVGDSQTMAAESGVLGVPFIRYNDFVGRIGYLKELEDDYNLGYGIKPDQPELLIKTVKRVLNEDANIYVARKNKFIKDKVNVAECFYEIIQGDNKNV
jgi:uncharacterized protein